MFNAIFFDPSEAVSDDQHRLVSDYNHEESDPRSIFVVFHAVFTEYVIAEGLARGLESREFGAADETEACARLSFILQKYRLDLNSLSTITTVIGDGLKMRNELHDRWLNLVERAGGYARGLELHGQGYNFDLRTFRERNPSAYNKPRV